MKPTPTGPERAGEAAEGAVWFISRTLSSRRCSARRGRRPTPWRRWRPLPKRGYGTEHFDAVLVRYRHDGFHAGVGGLGELGRSSDEVLHRRARGVHDKGRRVG